MAGQTIRLAIPVSSSRVTKTTPRALPDQHEPGDREAPPDRHRGEVGGGDEAFPRQFGAQKGERVALYREARRRVILDDMLAQWHLRQQRRRAGFAQGRLKGWWRSVPAPHPNPLPASGEREPFVRFQPLAPLAGRGR